MKPLFLSLLLLLVSGALGCYPLPPETERHSNESDPTGLKRCLEGETITGWCSDTRQTLALERIAEALERE